MTDTPAVEAPADAGPRSTTAGKAASDGGKTDAARHGVPRQTRQSRKRTKTGCLTCRRRRIKCGEERPICDNCIKSKRHCEGYNQRVIFKEPIGAFQMPGGLMIQSTGTKAGQLHRSATTDAVFQASTSARGQSYLPVLAPRPVYQYDADLTRAPSSAYRQPAQAHSADRHTELEAQIYHEGDLPPRLRQLTATSGVEDTARQKFLHEPNNGQLHSAPAFQTQGIAGPAYRHQPPASYPLPDSKARYLGNEISELLSRETASAHDSAYKARLSAPQLPGAYNQYLSRGATIPDASNRGPSSHAYDDRTGSYTSNVQSINKAQLSSFAKEYKKVEFDHEAEEFAELPPERDSDNNAFEDSYNSEHKLGLMIAFRAGKDNDAWPRSFNTLLDEPNMLAMYTPTISASPLQDGLTARIFCHFVIATGPTLSIFERHPTNPSVLFSGEPVPSSQQNLWTYTVPTLALRHQALLHAVLALASLHIARLQGTAVWPSLKHYHIALRRIRKAHQTPSKRGHIATLAATLILGFYEVMSAEHAKWSSHLLGAKQLLTDYDFLSMTKYVRSRRHRQRPTNSGFSHWSGALSLSRTSEAAFPIESAMHGTSELNEGLVSIISGKEVRYDHYGRILSDFEDQGTAGYGERSFSRRDLEEFATRSDLFWWFCKQDVYQSIISGNGLLLDYNRWTHCLPRGPVGRKEAIYGTMDHLVLLLGRIADFAAKDQRRKVKVVEASGGQWRPPPWMDMGGPPRPPQPPQQQPPQSSVPGPELHAPSSGKASGMPPPRPGALSGAPTFHDQPMYGMIPPIGPPRVPSWSDTVEPPEQDPSDDPVLESATLEAEQKWMDIKAALRVFEESLGPDFQQLGPEEFMPETTPFGPARRFGSHAIACIWVLYYMGCIITERMHPAMPPAAMMAAGVAARKTARYANEICRIFAAMAPSDNTTQLSPALGAALMESTLGLFFAGVQIQDPFQRVWLVGKLTDISQLTGWKSASAIALGCETAWTKAAQLGRGPPYERMPNMEGYDDKVPPEHDLPEKNIERRFVKVNPAARVIWALGLLSLDEDVRTREG